MRKPANVVVKLNHHYENINFITLRETSGLTVNLGCKQFLDVQNLISFSSWI